MREVVQALRVTPRVLALVWRAHPPTTAALLALNILQGFTPLINGSLTKLVLDAVVVAVSSSGDALAHAPGIAALLVARALSQVLNAAAGAPARYFWQQLSDHLTRDVEKLILGKASSFNGIAFFESPRFFDLLQRAQNQSINRPINMVNNTMSALRTTISLVSMSAVFFLFSPWVALFILVATVPQLVGEFLNRRETWQINNWSIPEVRTMGYMTNLLTWKDAAKEVRLFGLGDYFLGIFRNTFTAFHTRYARARRRQWRITLVLSALSAAGFALGYGALIFAAVGGGISLGHFALLYSALNQMRDGLNGLVWQLSALYEGNLYMSTLFELEAVEDTLPLAAPARPAPSRLSRGIELRGIGFTYPSAEKAVLENVSFSITPGQTVALVGENGAGKSTLVKLLTRLYDPTAGQIMVDGVDVRELDLPEWRRRVAVVLQDFTQYALPARENIGIGWLPRLEDPVAVRAAAVAAGADSLVARLPEGYDTMLGRQFRSIGTDGVNLSGGEWQRIALARAFMREDAQLLILDEPTSALDARAEHDLFQRFRALTAGRATLLISHRFSTVRLADHIVVLDGGRIVEQGPHAALVAQGGMYAHLYAMQAERYV